MQRLLIVLMCAMAMQAQQPSQPSRAASPADPARTANEERIKQQAILIPQGLTVEMRLVNGKKLRGQLGRISDEGVAIRSVFENRIEERTINFADIKSLRYHNPMMPRLITTYILAGVSMAVSIGLAATR